MAALGNFDRDLTQELRRFRPSYSNRRLAGDYGRLHGGRCASSPYPMLLPPGLRSPSIEWTPRLNPLNQFILPGGHASRRLGSYCPHRLQAGRATSGGVNSIPSRMTFHGENYERALVFLNRLSDYFFMLARYCNKLHTVADMTWEPSTN